MGALVLAFLRRHGFDLIFVALGIALVRAVVGDAFGFRITTFSPGSDAWEHAAALRRLLDAPLHPTNPHFATADSSPRYMPHFLLIAGLSRLLDFRSSLDALGVAAVANTVLFLSGIAFFFRVYFRDRRAPLYGLVIALCSWWEAWHFSNVYQLDVYFSVASYPSTAALGVTLWGLGCTALALRRDRRSWPLLGAAFVLAAYLFLLHPLTAVAGLVGMGCLVLFEPEVEPRRRLEVLSALVLGTLFTHFWPYFSPFRVLLGGQGHESDWAQKAVSQASRVADFAVKRKLHKFYDWDGIKNTLGYSLVGVVVLPVLLARRRHLFLVVASLIVVTPFVLNLFVTVPLAHRFILLVNLFLQMALVWLLLRVAPGGQDAPQLRQWSWSPKRPRPLDDATTSGDGRATVTPSRRRLAFDWARSAAVLGFLAFLVFQNVERTERRFADYERRYHHRAPDGSFRDSNVVRNAKAITKAAGKDAVVLCEPSVSWSLSAFGPRVVSIPHSNPLVADGRRREREVQEFFARGTKDERRDEILRRYHVSHVVLGSRSGRYLNAYWADRELDPVALRNGLRLVTLGVAENRPW